MTLEPSVLVWALIIIIGIFQLILFVKIWNMTGDVSSISAKFARNYKYIDYINLAKEEKALGNGEKAKEYLQRAKVRAELELPSYPEHLILDAINEIDELLK